MRVTVLLFAALREALGQSRLDVELGGKATIHELLETLRTEHPGLRAARFTVALNRTYCDERHPLVDGDQVALIPPVSGG